MENNLESFHKWKDFSEFVKNKINIKPFSGAGINYRSNNKLCLLKSIDNTYYYDDDLNNIDEPIYTLFGHNGDQDENEPRFNEPLLNPNKTKFIYLYRLKYNQNKKTYLWYGKYIIQGKIIK